MADDIKQTLGFDASQALDTLRQLDQVMATFEQRLNSAVTALSNFNSRSGKTVSALKQIQTNAKLAAEALGKVENAQGKAGSGGATSARNTGAPKSAINAQQQLLKGQQAAQAFENLFLPASQRAQQAASAITTATNQIGSQTQSNLARARNSVGQLSVSWQTLVRVVQTQFIVRALSQLRDAFRESVGDAIDFQKQVALITTIADGIPADRIAQGVRNISDNFNIPLLETARGVYQALSNQVGDFGESLKFTEEAAKFARATNSSLANSVDLLSGATKSFGLDVSDTGKVAGIFFTAIDKGRVTAEELANTFGRIGPSAKQVGITLEEFAAGAAEISVKGVATNEALTQFRGIITGLTKPTDAMKDKLAELGFSSTESAIATLRLDGLLDALADSTNGSAQAFAKLFPNVRGLGGALSVTGDNLRSFSTTIKAAQKSGSDFANQKFLQAIDTDAEKVTAAFNKLKNALIIDFGQAVIASGKHLLELVGGVENLITAGRLVVPGIIRVGVAVGALTLGLKAAALAALLLKTNLAGSIAGVTAAGISLVPQALEAVAQKRSEINLRGLNEQLKFNEKEKAAFESAENTKVKEATEGRDKILQLVGASVRQINVKYLEDVANAKSANEAMVENTETILNRIVGAREQLVRGLATGIENANQQIIDSQNRIKDLRQNQGDLQFEGRTRGLADAQKAFALIQRSAQLASQAESDLSAAIRSGSQADLTRAQSLFDKANSELQAAGGLASRIGNAGLERRILGDQNSLIERRIRGEQQIARIAEQRKQALDQEKTKQEALLALDKKDLKLALDNAGAFDKQGNLFSQDEQERRAQQRQAALKRIAERALNSADFDSTKALGLADLATKIEGELGKKPIRLIFDIESSIQKLQAEMQKSLNNIDVKLPFLKQLETTLGRSLRGEGPEAINQGLRELEDRANSLGGALKDVKFNDQSIAQSRAEIEALIKTFEQRAGRRKEIREQLGEGSNANKAIQGFERSIELLRVLATQSDITKEKIAAAAQAGATAAERIGGTTFLGIRTGQIDQLSEEGELLAQVIGRIGEVAAKQGKGAELLKLVPPGAQQELFNINLLFQQIGASQQGLFEKSATAVTNTVPPMKELTTQSGTQASNATKIAEGYERAARASQQIKPPVAPAGPDPQRKALGGLIQGFNKGGFVRYFNAGGFAPRGTDTIPAMLSPGEYVINARSTKKFFSQLQAINAGVAPVYREDGGAVTNVSIGDIVLNNAGNTSRQQARSIVTELRREFRRHTSSF